MTLDGPQDIQSDQALPSRVTIPDVVKVLDSVQADMTIHFVTKEFEFSRNHHVAQVTISDHRSHDIEDPYDPWTTVTLQLSRDGKYRNMKTAVLSQHLKDAMAAFPEIEDIPLMVEADPSNIGVRRYVLGGLSKTAHRGVHFELFPAKPQ